MTDVMVNFKSQLVWIKEYQRAGKALFLGMSLRGFPERTGMRISELSKGVVLSPSVSGHHLFPESSYLTKRQKGKYTLCLLEYGPQNSTFSGLPALGLQSAHSRFSGLQPGTEFHCWGLGVHATGVGLSHTAGCLGSPACTSWDFSASRGGSQWTQWHS